MSCILGIDIGTTSVKACLVNSNTKELVGTQKKDTYSDVPSELGNEGNKQNVPRILSSLQMCISRLPKEHLRNVKCIGVCGQMHGCMLWKQGSAWEQKADSDRYEIKEVSDLYTWQDSRCTDEFLQQLLPASSHLSINSGYGCATLLWFLKNKPEILSKFNRGGTIHDFFVAMICGLDKPVMSVQNAASWGYFDTVKEEWNTEQLSGMGLPLELLPEIVSSGKKAGVLKKPWHGIPENTPVLASLGDFQCSLLSAQTEDTDAFINVSTSLQMCFLMPKDFSPSPVPPESTQPVEHFPFFDGNYVACAASLNGGNILASFVRMIQQWVLDLGYQAPQSKIWERILKLAEDSPDTNPSLSINPTLFKERYAPHCHASVANISLDNVSLGRVTRSLCKGIVTNLHNMIPREMLELHGITRIVGGGSALVRNPILQKEFEEVYKLPLTLNSKGGDAAYGAALVGLKML